MAFRSNNTRDPACSVYVGNIPYNATEHTLSDWCSRAGNVVDFRIIVDRATGRSKGYGFCQYENPNMASEAIRVLNGQDFSGRTIRIEKAQRNS